MIFVNAGPLEHCVHWFECPSTREWMLAPPPRQTCVELFRDGVGHVTDRSRLSWNPTKYKIHGFSTNSESEEARGAIQHIWRLRLCSEIIHINFRLNMFNPLNAELSPICHLLALLGAHRILHVSKLRVNERYCSQPTATHGQSARPPPPHKKWIH